MSPFSLVFLVLVLLVLVLVWGRLMSPFSLVVLVWVFFCFGFGVEANNLQMRCIVRAAPLAVSSPTPTTPAASSASLRPPPVFPWTFTSCRLPAPAASPSSLADSVFPL